MESRPTDNAPPQAPAPVPTVAEAVAELLTHGGFSVETALESSPTPILRTVLYLDGDAVTYVASAALGTPELARAMVDHAKTIDDRLAALARFSRAFDGVGLVFGVLGALGPLVIDLLLERNPFHAGGVLVLSLCFVRLVALAKGADGRRLARTVVEAIEKGRRPAKSAGL